MMDFVDQALHILPSLFLLAVGTTLLVLLFLLMVDLAQTANAVRRNYPVIGCFRRVFEGLGEFMRQYMFAMDREEMPFNRAQRNWVHRASSAGSTTVAFGSTRETRWPGTAIFANAPFSLLEEEYRDTSEVTIGKGGILPGAKVTEEIAGIRGIRPGEDAVSPNRHREVSNNGELRDLINRVRDVGGKPTGYKAVIGNPNWLDELFELINRRGPDSAPDFITVDSGDGGTGAAPMPLMDNVGMVLRESLIVLVDASENHGLRERVRVVASGKLVTPTEAAWALCAGADFAVSARGFMFALGCIQAMRCNKNTCPTGITTHNRRLRRGLDPPTKAVSVANYQRRIEEELKIIAHSCGIADPRLLRREHCRIVHPDGSSRLLSEIYPRAA